MRQLFRSASIVCTACVAVLSSAQGAVSPAPAPAAAAAAPAAAAAAASAAAERAAIEQWQAKRLENLTSDSGWLTLAGLYWLNDGENTFGSAKSNTVRLDNAAVAAKAGSFVRTGKEVRFVARPDGGITQDGQPVTTVDLVSDTAGEPTVLESGPVSFFLIERGGKYGVRVRDKNSPHRTHFAGLQYFPIRADWAIDARFEPYEPHRHIRITNILGMEEDMDSPGALVFTQGGHEWRLDTILETPDDQELFVMFADGTSGKETYGAGRFMYLPLPRDGTVRLDFNKAYNPPCAFNDFATCPLPPFQNRLALRVDAGEKSYAGHSK
ncbi:MAG: DUF1684 domain-containing protein [Gammaproteobacteria bacterium]